MIKLLQIDNKTSKEYLETVYFISIIEGHSRLIKYVKIWTIQTFLL